MKKIKSINKSELSDINNPYMIMFTADWCPKCRMIKVMIDAEEAHYQPLDFYELDVDKNDDIIKEFGIRGLPLLCLFSKNGKEVNGYTDLPEKDSVLLSLGEFR